MPYFRFCLILNALGTIGTIKKQAGKFNFGILQCLFQKKKIFFCQFKVLNRFRFTSISNAVTIKTKLRNSWIIENLIIWEFIYFK